MVTWALRSLQQNLEQQRYRVFHGAYIERYRQDAYVSDKDARRSDFSTCNSQNGWLL